jgi:23S rRNA U2552 (ribose-2'-O)-methylase RlmE/FtsJ
VCKVFEGDLFKEFLDRVRAEFDHVRVSHPEASRKSSSEVFVIAKRFRGKVPARPAEPAAQELAGRYELRL